MAKTRILYKEASGKWSSYRFPSGDDPPLETIVHRLLSGEHPLRLGAVVALVAPSFKQAWRTLYSKEIHSLQRKGGAVRYALSSSKWIDAAFISKPE